MRRIFFVIFALACTSLNAQQNEANCMLLKNIAKDMNHEIEKNLLLKNINDIHLLFSPDDGSKRIVYDKDKYSKEKVDSIITSLDSFEVLSDDILSFGNSLQIVDTLSFFTARCSIRNKRFDVAVVNEKSKNNMEGCWYLYSFGTHDDFLIVTFFIPKASLFLNYYFSLGANEMVLVKKKVIERNRE